MYVRAGLVIHCLHPDRHMKKNRLLALLVISVGINYIDRGNLSVAAPDLIRELSLSTTQVGLLFSAFFWTYASFQLLSGWLIDRYNVHWVYGISFLVWTAATALIGMVSSFGLLLMLRLLLGAGEAAAYPSCSKIIASDYAEHERGIANALVDAASKIGPALGTLLGGLIVAQMGWRSLFLILGFGGVLWLPFWFLSKPKHSEEIRPRTTEGAPGMLQIMRLRSAWGTFLGLFCLNYAWYFLLSWLPYYLVHERHFSLRMMAVIGSVPFWGLGVSSLIGGWASDRWILRGGSPTRVRKTFVVAGLLMCTLLVPAAIVKETWVSMALIITVCLSFGLASSNNWAVTQTLAGPLAAGKWTGLQNAIGNLGGVVAPYLTGVIVAQTKSFYLAFLAAAVMAVLGAISYGLIVGRLETQNWNSPENVKA